MWLFHKRKCYGTLRGMLLFQPENFHHLCTTLAFGADLENGLQQRQKWPVHKENLHTMALHKSCWLYPGGWYPGASNCQVICNLRHHWQYTICATQYRAMLIMRLNKKRFPLSEMQKPPVLISKNIYKCRKKQSLESRQSINYYWLLLITIDYYHIYSFNQFSLNFFCAKLYVTYTTTAL